MRGLSGIAKAELMLGGALLVGLGYLWLGTDLQLKNLKWRPPAAQHLQLQGLFDVGVPSARTLSADSADAMLIKERPLFVLGRRLDPPSPVVQAAAPVAKNVWDQAVLLGVFQGPVSGIIFRAEGKDQRLLLNQSYEGWTLSSIGSRRVELRSADSTLFVELQKADMTAARAPLKPLMAIRASTPKASSEGRGPASADSPGKESDKPVEKAVFGGTAQ